MPDIATPFFIVLAALCGWLIGRRASPPPAPARAPRSELRAVPIDVAPRQDGALALFDVDDLQGVNIESDFDTGDRLLSAMGDVLRRALPGGGGLERLESGRFLVWLPGMALAEAETQIEHLRRLASSAVVHKKVGAVSRTLSAGVVTSLPDEGRPRAILRADAALVRAKGLGGDRTAAVGALPIPSLAPPRSEIEAAIAARALEYHVQPIFDLRSRQAAGVEALLRWNRNDGVVLGPAGFLDTLNRIPEAGADLFPALAVEAATPFVTGPKPIYATFNITGAVLDGENSPGCRWLSAVLDRIPAEHLVLEIVETAVIVKPDRAARLMEKLRDRGVRIALDDFGTGLSNMERLQRFAVDILKIDRTFIDGLGGCGREEAILASLVALTGGLDIDLVAEGIETEAQVDILRNLGVHYGQGFHLGRPACAADWAERIATGFTA